MTTYSKLLNTLNWIFTYLPETKQENLQKGVKYKILITLKNEVKCRKSQLIHKFSKFPKYRMALIRGNLKIEFADNFREVVLTFIGDKAKELHLKTFIFCCTNKMDFIDVKDLSKYPNGDLLELQYYQGDIYSPPAYTYGNQKPQIIDWI